jgi:hypothetical protein
LHSGQVPKERTTGALRQVGEQYGVSPAVEFTTYRPSRLTVELSGATTDV